jgi:hypothetical protein
MLFDHLLQPLCIDGSLHLNNIHAIYRGIILYQGYMVTHIQANDTCIAV